MKEKKRYIYSNSFYAFIPTPVFHVHPSLLTAGSSEKDENSSAPPGLQQGRRRSIQSPFLWRRRVVSREWGRCSVENRPTMLKTFSWNVPLFPTVIKAAAAANVSPTEGKHSKTRTLVAISVLVAPRNPWKFHLSRC